MKIALVSLYKSYPPNFGSARLVYNIFTNLSGKVFLIQLGLINKSIVLNKNKKVVEIQDTSKSRLEKFFNFFNNLNRILLEIKKINPDIIILEGGSWAFYYLLLFNKLKKFKKKVFYHEHNLEYWLREKKENWLVRKITFYSERCLLKNCDKSFIVSRKYSLACKKLYGVEPYVLSNMVDMERFEKIDKKKVSEIKKKYSFGKINVLFMGIPSYKPNREAIECLRKIIMPNLLKKYKEAKLIFTGGLLENPEEFIINPGEIENLPEFISACDICVAPMLSGPGPRLKILEYMALGKPVVSTRIGVDSIEVKNGENVLLEDKISQFHNKISFLIENKNFRNKLGKGAKKLIKKEYDSKRIVEKLEEEIINQI